MENMMNVININDHDKIIEVLKKDSICYVKFDDELKEIIDQILIKQKLFFDQSEEYKNKFTVDYVIGYVPKNLERKKLRMLLRQKKF